MSGSGGASEGPNLPQMVCAAPPYWRQIQSILDGHLEPPIVRTPAPSNLCGYSVDPQRWHVGQLPVDRGSVVNDFDRPMKSPPWWCVRLQRTLLDLLGAGLLPGFSRLGAVLGAP